MFQSVQLDNIQIHLLIPVLIIVLINFMLIKLLKCAILFNIVVLHNFVLAILHINAISMMLMNTDSAEKLTHFIVLI